MKEKAAPLVGTAREKAQPLVEKAGPVAHSVREKAAVRAGLDPNTADTKQVATARRERDVGDPGRPDPA